MQMVDNNGPPQPPTREGHRGDSQTSAASNDESPDSTTRDVSEFNAGIAKEGHLQYGTSESRYVGSTHWSAILENIQELKSALGGGSGNSPEVVGGGGGGDDAYHPTATELDESDDVEPAEMDGLFGSTSHLSLASIISQALPPREVVDRRLSTYFQSSYMVIPFIHARQFQRQYEQFWRTPYETSPLWISMLFSICCMSATLSEAVGSEPSTPEDQPSPRATFLNAACQCLRLGGFLRPKRWVVEALGLYAHSKFMSTLDPARDVGVIFAIVVRLAYRSGYHRDPSQFAHISVFDGEMRRRTWAMCRQFDLMVSFQLGLPNLIPHNSWDTQNPRNLHDADFDEDCKVLPPSRPETEASQILYFIVKSRLMTTFGKVCAHALTFTDCDPATCARFIMELDREVRATYATVPEVLHIKPMSQSYADPSYLTMVRTNCEFLYQKSLLVLHRKYMTQDVHYHAGSIKACTDAALAITRHML
ncbi:MAG: fungal specific transcription factor domain-containing protein, partial [Terriglobus roseus]|nr:fungal specific transcription factor domain-containing protein [Terriglobus roseus]